MTDDRGSPHPAGGRAGSGGRRREGRGRASPAREAAEALFRPKPAAEPTAPDNPLEDQSARRPRVLPASPVPPAPPAITDAPVTTQPKAPGEIPAAEFARIRAWVNYGMTAREVAEIYRTPVKEIRRILRRA